MTSFEWPIDLILSREDLLKKHRRALLDPALFLNRLLPKQRRIFCLLFCAYPKAVKTNDLIDSVFGVKHYGRTMLPYQISKLRRALSPTFQIVTKPKYGYALHPDSYKKLLEMGL